MIDRIENDPSGTAVVLALLDAAAQFRVPKPLDRFFLLLDKMKDRQGSLAYRDTSPSAGTINGSVTRKTNTRKTGSRG